MKNKSKSRENVEIRKIEETFYSSSLFSFFKDKFIIIFFLTIPAPLLTVLILWMLSKNVDENDLISIIVASILSVSTYFGAALFSLSTLYNDWSTKKQQYMMQMVNVCANKAMHDDKVDQFMYEIEPSTIFDNYRNAYGLQKASSNKFKLPDYYGFSINILNQGYYDIAYLELTRAGVFCPNGEKQTISRFWGTRHLIYDVIKHGREVKDFIIVDRDFHLSRDDVSKIVLKYKVSTIKEEYYLLYVIKFCQVAMYEKSVFYPSSLLQKIYRKLGDSIETDELICNELE